MTDSIAFRLCGLSAGEARLPGLLDLRSAPPRCARACRPACGGPRLRRAVLAALSAALVACGNYGGDSAAPAGQVPVPSNPATGGGSSSDEMITAFSQTVFPLLRTYCVDCHAGAGPGTPHIAHADAATAYANVWDQQKVSLTAPETSRLVRRLVTDFHHCWSTCVMDGAEMQAAIAAWASMVQLDPGGGTSVTGLSSAALTLADGFEDEGAERYQENVIALFEFKEGSGSVARDTSGVAPAMDLTLTGPTFMSSYGIDIAEGSAAASPGGSRKLYDRLADPEAGTQQYSVEAWLVPANTTLEGPARIVSYSSGTGNRNFHLGQVLYNYDFRNRSLAAEINNNGAPSLQTYDGDQDLQATLQHVVITFDQYRGRRINVNGQWTEDVDEQGGDRLWTWSPNYTFLLGNETSGDRQWEGKIQLVAIYDVALSDAQILQNFKAGVGKRLIMRFDVSQWIGPGSYVEFVVSELDDHSYLFCEPTLVSGNPNGFRVSNLRITVNGQAPVAGQAFVNVDAAVVEDRQLLSRQCSVVSKDRGPADDVFAVEFEILGGFEEPVVPAVFPPPPPADFGDPLPQEGARNFARINETMSAVTGVDANSAGTRQAFEELTQSLPGDYDLRSFSSSNQVAISKLALEYCDALVETPALRQAFFGTGFAFDAAVPTAFAGQAQRDLIIDALVDGILNVNVANQPSAAEVAPILDALIGDLTAGCTAASCGPAVTRNVVKGACAAVLASAGTTVH